MTPSQKQNLINSIKLVHKKAEEEKALDPNTIKAKIESGEVNPCEGFKQCQRLEELKQKSAKGAKVLSMAEVEGATYVDLRWEPTLLAWQRSQGTRDFADFLMN